MNGKKANNWFNDAILYHIFVDSFSTSSLPNRKKASIKLPPQFLGGNLKAILLKLDHIQQLGCNSIWLSPFYSTSAYHGYHITDFTAVDSHFGKISDLEKLITEVHSRDMKIIADFVPNHCSNQHPWFLDAQKNKNSKFANWFLFKNWPEDYLCFFNYKELPKLNLENPETETYMINVAKFWLDKGVDGFRIDHVVGISRRFWKKFRTEISKDFPHAILFGEAWLSGLKKEFYPTVRLKNKNFRKIFGINQSKLQLDYKYVFDGILDFVFQTILTEEIALSEKIDTKKLQKRIAKHLKKYSSQYQSIQFLDNHDMNRFLYECGGDNERLKKAINILFSTHGPKVLYYGTECPLSQKWSVYSPVPYPDVAARQPIDWNKTELKEYISESIKNQHKYE